MIFKKFHIFIRPSGDVLIVVKNLYYLIDFPSFNVKSGYNGQSIENLGIPKEKGIDAIFRTYSGKTYIYIYICMWKGTFGELFYSLSYEGEDFTKIHLIFT
jgi:hypothetical protein